MHDANAANICADRRGTETAVGAMAAAAKPGMTPINVGWLSTEIPFSVALTVSAEDPIPFPAVTVTEGELVELSVASVFERLQPHVSEPVHAQGAQVAVAPNIPEAPVDSVEAVGEMDTALGNASVELARGIADTEFEPELET